MTVITTQQAYDELYSYCRERDFAGHDPFDGLNSSLFQALPLKHVAPARLAWLQAVKRSPLDLRKAFRVPPGVNPKGLALFALAELSRFRESGDDRHAGNARGLIDRLLSTRIGGTTKDGRRTTAFGYNFDWQSRVFYTPRGTPAIVPTAFASQALIEAYDALGDDEYLKVADEICAFILSDLNRMEVTDDEVCFSYTPLDHSIIFNASLLAGESLARVGDITGNTDYLEMAANTVRFVMRRQTASGAWAYGSNEVRSWADNFHTAYILLSLYRISGVVEELRSETFENLRDGANYWLNNFFLNDGTPKYYDNAIYPVDIHSAAVAIAALSELRVIDDRMLPMAKKTGDWTIANIRSPLGFFYYQKRERRIIKTPFMRWGQAWMAYALARLTESGS